MKNNAKKFNPPSMWSKLTPRVSLSCSPLAGDSYLGGNMVNSHLDPLFREIFSPYLGEPKKDKIICNRCGQESEIEAVAKCQICGSFAVRLVEVAK
jgi:ribosomal protein L40E